MRKLRRWLKEEVEQEINGGEENKLKIIKN